MKAFIPITILLLYAFRQDKTIKTYAWLDKQPVPSVQLINRIPAPLGYKRMPAEPGKLTHWLEHLPLLPAGTQVKLYNGRIKTRQDVHEAIVDIDCGTKDLQQCADAVMRLHAEYLYAQGLYNEIVFTYTSGDTIPFKKWAEGFRPVIKGNNVNWIKSHQASSSYETFKAYLWNVFTYAGSLSLSRELKSVDKLYDIQCGDVFIVGGSPGHAVTVIDVVVQEKTGKKLFLLAQSYMPAQQIHVLKNFTDASLSPWYSVDFGEELKTPEWTFTRKQLMRFK